jgi:hypothetical protein
MIYGFMDFRIYGFIDMDFLDFQVEIWEDFAKSINPYIHKSIYVNPDGFMNMDFRIFVQKSGNSEKSINP